MVKTKMNDKTLTEMRNKLNIEETNKNRNTSCVRNDSVKREKLQKSLCLARENDKMKQSRNNKYQFKISISKPKAMFGIA